MSETIDAVKQYDPAVVKTKVGFYRTLYRMWLMRSQRCVPAIVTKYDKTIHVANVIPVPMKVYEDSNGRKINKERPEYTVPVMNFNHGSFHIFAPLRPGDTGYLFACDRNCEKTMYEKNDSVITSPIDKEEIYKDRIAPPDDGVVCDFRNGFFVPCSWASDSEDYDEDDNPYDPKENNSLVIKSSDTGDNLASIKVILKRKDDGSGSVFVECGDVMVEIDSSGGIWITSEKAESTRLVSDVRSDPSGTGIQKKTIEFKKLGDVLYGPENESDWIKS